MFSQSPVYNLRAALKATGLKADVLRAWERRYGLPRPQRTPGGHRLYSERDLETVKWLRARQVEGLSISRAVDLWKELIGAGRDPFSEYPSGGTDLEAGVTALSADRLDWLRQEWLRAVVDYDGVRADAILNQAFTLFPAETVLVHLLQQGLRQIGDLWFRAKLTEQHEHFATGMASRRLHALIASAPHAPRPQTVCVGCPPGEWHTFPVELLGWLLQRRGLSVLFLGADVPIDHLAEATRAAGSDLVVLAAQSLATAATLQQAARALQADGTPLAFGGLAFARIPGLRERIPAYFLGEDLETSVGAVEQLLLAPAPFPSTMPKARRPQRPNQQLLEKQAWIERSATKKLLRAGFPPQAFQDARTFFSAGLAAALQLGDPAFLEPDLEWLRERLAVRGVQPGALEAYLEAYAVAAREQLGEAGRSVADWLHANLTRNRPQDLRATTRRT